MQVDLSELTTNVGMVQERQSPSESQVAQPAVTLTAVHPQASAAVFTSQLAFLQVAQPPATLQVAHPAVSLAAVHWHSLLGSFTTFVVSIHVSHSFEAEHVLQVLDVHWKHSVRAAFVLSPPLVHAVHRSPVSQELQPGLIATQGCCSSRDERVTLLAVQTASDVSQAAHLLSIQGRYALNAGIHLVPMIELSVVVQLSYL